MTTRISGTFVSNTLSSGQDDELTSGSDTSAVLSGGELFVDSGAAVASATVYAGGLLFLSSGASGSDDVINGGSETVDGTETAATLVSGGFTVASGGTVNGVGDGGFDYTLPPPASAFSGGIAVVESGGTFTNSGSVVGGSGSGIDSGADGAGGAGLLIVNGGFVNSGLVAGGDGGYFGEGTGGAGGVGVIQSGGVFANFETVSGGSGGYDAAGAGIGGAGVIENAGVFNNSGTVSGGSGGLAYNPDVGSGGGAGVVLGGGLFNNYGLLSGGSGSDVDRNGPAGAGGAGADVTGGVLVNSGVVSGGGGGSGATVNPGAGGAGVFLDGGTFVNAGTVIGGRGGTGRNISGATGDAVQFGSDAAATLVLDPGAVFSGLVVADSAVDDVLELSGTSSATLSGLGSEFTGFSELVVASGANWTLAPQTVSGSAGAGGGRNGGAGGAAIVDNGGSLYSFASISGGAGGLGTISGGTGGAGVVENGGLFVNSGVVTGGARGNSLLNAGVAGVGVQLDGGTFVNAGVVSGSLAVQFGSASPATLVVDPGAVFSGLVVADSALNDVLELAGTSPATLSGLGTEFTGFSELLVASGANWTLASPTPLPTTTLVSGTLSGVTVSAGDALTVAAGGLVYDTTVLSGGQLFIGAGGAGSGDVVSGGSDTVYGSETGATLVGGVFIVEGGGIANGVGGSSGSTGYSGGGGGAAVVESAGSFSNSGNVTGGSGGAGGNNGGGGGAGVVESGGSYSNTGNVSGGVGGDSNANVYGLFGGGGGAGVVESGGSFSNSGNVSGGAGGGGIHGGGGGAGVIESNGSFLNAAGGIVAGGRGGGSFFYGSAGDGVDVSGGRFENAGTVSGADAVRFGGAATLVVDPTAVFEGAVAASTQFEDVLELSGTSAATLSGLGAEFTGFSELLVDSGANWTLTSQTALPATALVYGTLSGATVYSGESLTVEAGGAVVSTTVENGGTLTISAGGSGAGDLVSGGSEILLGAETGVTVDASGDFYVTAGGVVSGAVVSSRGQLEIEFNGSGFGDVVANGGVEVLDGTETSATVLAGGTLIEEGGVLSGATLSGGVIVVQGPGAPTGAIVFGGGVDQLQLDSLSPSTFGATLSGFKAGDTIDLVAYSPTSLVYSGGLLTVSGGGGSESFHIAGATAAGFVLSSDGHLGTLITGVADTPPTITAQTPAVVEAGQSTIIATVQTGAAGAALQLENVSAADGTLGLVPTGSGSYNVVYTANASVPSSVLDSVTYTVADTLNFSSDGLASVQLDAGPTLAPNAPAEVGHGQTVEIATVAPGLAGDTLGLSQTSGSGTLTISSGGVYYTAPSVVSGGQIDTLAYTISDQHNDATVSGGAAIALDPGPTAENGALTIGHGQSESTTAAESGLVTPGLPADTETVTAVSATAGSVTLVNGLATYTAPASGTATIFYTVTDQLGDAASGQIAVTVDTGPTVTNEAPTYVAAGVATTVGTVTPGLSYDSLYLAALISPIYGSLSLSNGNVVYQQNGTVPAGGEVDSFQYEIGDEYGDLSPPVGAIVTVDPGPTANAGAITVGHSQSGLNETAYLAGLFAAGATGDGTTITSVSGATLSGGQVIYTPPASGSPNFTYTVTNSVGQSASNTVTVTVDPGPKLTPTSAASIAADKLAKAMTEALGTVSPGIAGDALTLSYTSSQGGVVALNAGQIVYTAPASIKSATPDAVSYTIADPYGDKVTGSASVVLDPGPTAGGGQITVNQGVSVNETAYLLSLVTPGLAGDSETIASVAGANVKLVGGVVTYTAPATASDSFTYTVQDGLGDSATGTVMVAVNLNPTLSGTKAAQPTTNGKAVTPFAGVTVVDPNAGATETLFITLSGGGTLADGTGYTGLGVSGAASGIYVLQGSATAVTKELDALIFTPAAASPNTVATTGFTLQDVSSVGTSVTNATASVVNTNPAVAPVVSGALTGQVFGVSSPDAPFSKMVVSDANANTTDTVLIGVTGGGALSGAGLSKTSTAGIYQLAATSAANATSELEALLYTPVATGAAQTISFAVNDTTSASTVCYGPTTTITIDPGPKAGTVSATVAYGTALNLTSAVLAAATPGLKGDTLTITADNVSATLGNVSLAGGQLIYTASSAAVSNIPANGSLTDSLGYTISDPYGDTATGTAKITVTNRADTINGGPYGQSTIEGTSGADVINAFGWYNTIYDNGGNDLVNAGSGNATVYTSTGDVVVDLNGYYNTVSGGNGSDTVSGSLGNTTVTLGNGADNVSTGGYSNAITVGSGTDTIVAGAGLDTVTAGAGVEAITLAGYSDTVTLNGGTATVSGGQGLETVIATGGHDTLSFAGTGDLAEFFGAVTASLADMGGGLRIDVSTSAATLSLTGFGTTDTSGVIDLLGGAGGYKSAAAVLGALHSDGHGGTSLSLGSSGSIDFVNTAQSSLHASNFQIG